MSVRVTAVIALCLFGLTLPCEAARRTVHFFGEAYPFDFARDYVFVKREGRGEDKRQKVFFESGKRSIIVSAIVYDPANTAPIVSREAYMAGLTGAGIGNVKYVNEEIDAGRAGSVLLGSCKESSCLYKMSRAIGQKIWLSVSVGCNDCTKQEAAEAGQLADRLYGQLKSF